MPVGGQRHGLATLPTGKRPGVDCIGGWVGPEASLNGWEKSRPTRILSPDHQAHKQY